jgi:hypothetical protein
MTLIHMNDAFAEGLNLSGFDIDNSSYTQPE